MALKTEIETLRLAVRAADERGDRSDESERTRQRLREHVAFDAAMAARDRIASVAGMDAQGVAARLQALDARDARRTPMERAAVGDDERVALERRGVELAASAVAAPPDPVVAQRAAAIRQTHGQLVTANPMAASAFRLRNEWAFEPDPAA
jgi:hypothetical protein